MARIHIKSFIVSLLVFVMSSPIFSQAQCLPGDLASDRIALIKLYESLDYPSLANWGSSLPLSDWQGVTMSSGRVSELNLSGLNLAGKLPPELGQLTQLEKLNLSNNPQLEGLLAMDCLDQLVELEVNDCALEGLVGGVSYPALIKVRLQHNHLGFASLAQITNLSNVSDVVLSPQGAIGSEQTHVFEEGTNLVLDAGKIDNTAGNTYQWFKDGVAISGATTAKYTKANCTTADMGDYTCQMTNTNTVYTGLAIETKVQKVEITTYTPISFPLTMASTSQNYYIHMTVKMQMPS